MRQYIMLVKSQSTMPARALEEKVNVRFNSKLLALVDKAIDDLGIANDRSEFIRMAVAEKLERLGLFAREGKS